MITYIKFCFSFVLLFLLVSCEYQGNKNTNSLNGAWRMTSSKTIGPDGSEYPSSAQESFLLFTDQYYSMNRVSGNEPSEFYKKRFQPSESEKLNRYNSLLVNAGTYSVEDSVLVIQPVFALVPEFVGGIGKFDCTFHNDTLELDWKVILSADSVPDPYTSQGYHFEYKFVRY
jgi:hypothetical protein